MSEFFIHLLDTLPDLLWVGIAFWVLWKSLPELLRQVLPRLRSFKGFGIEAELTTERISDMAAERKLPFAQNAKDCLKRRLDLAGYAAHKARILWVDDKPNNNQREIDLLKGIGADVQTELTTDAGVAKTSNWKPDVVISDMGRPESKKAGFDLADRLAASDDPVPVIIYTTEAGSKMAKPANVFGMTARPDDLTHFVLDILERRRL